MPAAAARQEVEMNWRHYEDPKLSAILQSALSEFVAHGYHGTTVRAVASRAGVTVPALYYHFENKQALLVQLLGQSMRDVLLRCEAAFKGAGAEPEDQLSAVIECIVLYMVHRRDMAFLDTEIRSLEPVHRAAYVALRDQLEGLLRNTIHAGVRKGTFATRYTEDASRAILTMCQGVATWYRVGGALSPQEVGIRYVQFSLNVVGFVPPKHPHD